MRILDQAYAGKSDVSRPASFPRSKDHWLGVVHRFGYRPKPILDIEGRDPSRYGIRYFQGRKSARIEFPPIKSSPVPRSSRAIRKKTNFFRNRPCRDIRSPTYFVESRVQARISIYIYIYVALLEKESILDVNDVEAKKRKEKGRKAKRNGGDRAPARCTPHRHLSFRSSARPNIFRLYNKRSLCSHKLCKSMPRVI